MQPYQNPHPAPLPHRNLRKLHRPHSDRQLQRCQLVVPMSPRLPYRPHQQRKRTKQAAKSDLATKSQRIISKPCSQTEKLRPILATQVSGSGWEISSSEGGRRLFRKIQLLRSLSKDITLEEPCSRHLRVGLRAHIRQKLQTTEAPSSAELGRGSP